jgi:hypothetical protein
MVKQIPMLALIAAALALGVSALAQAGSSPSKPAHAKGLHQGHGQDNASRRVRDARRRRRH